MFAGLLCASDCRLHILQGTISSTFIFMNAKSTNPNKRAEIRKHYYLDEYVVIAPKRGVRPHVLANDKPVSIKTKKAPPIEKDPSVFEVPDPQEKDKWSVKVVDNLYPAFSIHNTDAFGKQEVVLETNQRNTPFCDLDVEQICRVFEAYRARLNYLRHIRGIKYVSIFKNHGREAGASLAHTHSQIIATGVVPPDVKRHAEAFAREQKRLGCSPHETIIRWEQDEGTRLVCDDEHTVTIAPFASRHPYEAWIIPRRQAGSLTDLSQAELASVAKQLKDVTKALSTQDFSYNFTLNERYDKQKGHHFYITVAPRPNIWAGFELNTGIIMHPMPPEEAAHWYREVIKEEC